MSGDRIKVKDKVFLHAITGDVIRLLRDKYEIEEPILTDEEKRYKEEIIDAMRDMINFHSVVGRKVDSLLEYIDKRFKILAAELGFNLSYESYKKIYYYLCRDFIGFNEIEPILRDYFIEDIECNGVNTPVYIIHRIYRNIKTNINFKNLDGKHNTDFKVGNDGLSKI